MLDHQNCGNHTLPSSSSSSSSSMLALMEPHQYHNDDCNCSKTNNDDNHVEETAVATAIHGNVFRARIQEDEEQQLLLSNRKQQTQQHHRQLLRHAHSSIVDYISKSPLAQYASSLTSSVRQYEINDDGNGHDEIHDDHPHKSGQHVLVMRENHVSMDKLNPHPSCETRRSSAFVAMINLVATVCGGGVLSLPLAFRRAGILPATLLMIVGAAITDFAVLCLVDSARKTGGRTYGDVAAAAFGGPAQVATTLALALELCGTLIAYQVLVRDIWTPVVVFLYELQLQNQVDSQYHPAVSVATSNAGNWLLAGILIIALPLLLKNDLHALRHTCYVGFSSCALLMLAVSYRAVEKLLGPTAPVDAGDGDGTTHSRSLYWSKIRWWSGNSEDFLFAFPIVVLCFFCSFNVLAIHSQLVNPSRERIRFVVGISMFLCFCIFFGVGLCGYLYTADTVTPDNIILAFPLNDSAIFAGRMGFCLTMLFALPLILLPCREAIISLPEQFRGWRRDAKLIAQFRKLNAMYEETHLHPPPPLSFFDDDNIAANSSTGYGTMFDSTDITSSGHILGSPHLVINGVDFDGTAPVLITRDPKRRHGTAILPVVVPRKSELASQTKEDTTAATSVMSFSDTFDLSPSNANGCMDENSDDNSDAMSATESVVHLQVQPRRPITTKSRLSTNPELACSNNCPAGSGEQNGCDSFRHVGVTLIVLIFTYGLAIMVPGVAAVWSIVGSSLAIWIAFVVPTACFLRIRQHKGLTMQALYAWILLAFSLVAMVACTRQAIRNAFSDQSS